MRSTRHVAPLVLTTALIAAGCIDGGEEQRRSPGGADSVVIVPQRDRTGMDTTSTLVNHPSFADDSSRDPAVRSDTSAGTLLVEGNGVAVGTWKFYDVTASLDEQTGGGTTRTILQVEAHRSSPLANFKFRLVSRTGVIRPGTFSLNARDADPLVEASWELDGEYYRHINGNGVVVIEEYDGKRVKGHFALHLSPVNPSSPRTPQQLTGRFDQVVLR